MSENKLLCLEILDIEIAQLENSKWEFPKKLAELKEVIAQKEQFFSVAKNNFEKTEKDISSAAIDLERQKKELEQSYERLNEVKNNKEYDAVQKEIRKRKAFVEETQHSIAKLKDKLPQTEGEFKAAQDLLEKTKAENSPEIDDLTNKIASIDSDILEKTAEKEKIVPLVPQNWLSVYNSILPGRKKSGKVLSLISSDSKVCAYCGQRLSPNMLKKIAISVNPVVCENCGSLFVFEEKSE